MTRSKAKTLIAWLVAMVALAALTGIALAASGYLIVPGHHGSVVGDNDITVTATGLQEDAWYVIKMDVSYHVNPRTPPGDEDYCKDLGGDTEWSASWHSDGSVITDTFTVPLPDCHCQITAGFTLLYSPSGDPAEEDWVWNGDENATQAVNIWSDCAPGAEGCTPGYWKNHLDAWGPTGFSPGEDFDTIFGVDLFDPDITLGEAVKAKGGGVNKLARHGTAALLSAAHPGVAYPLSVAEVIAAVQAGDADTLATANELGCPLN